jgi:nucleoid-associated protein YgaU
MFLKNSRYYGQATHTVLAGGRLVSLLTPRVLPAVAGEDHVVTSHDQLDTLAEQHYRDATRYWHIADANTALRAGELVAEPGTTMQLPGT